VNVNVNQLSRTVQVLVLVQGQPRASPFGLSLRLQSFGEKRVACFAAWREHATTLA